MRNLLFLILLTLTGCAQKAKESNLLKLSGANYSLSTSNFEETYNAVKSILLVVEPITIIAEVDHQKNAQQRSLRLGKNKTIFFGNPKLGTAFMQANQQAGLDLPQKISVFVDENDKTVLVYNSVDYLKKRHGVNPNTAPVMEIALKNIAEKASNSVIIANSNNMIANQGVVTVDSDQSFEATYESLWNALNSNPEILILAQLDHQKNAERVNLVLPPTRVIIFGNPYLGTPLMQESASTSLDLPQKILIYESNTGDVKIAYNDPTFIAKRHGLKNTDHISSIAKALKLLTEKAAGR